MDIFGRWTKTGLKVNLSNINSQGVDLIEEIADASAGNVSKVNNQLPDPSGNVTLTSDNIAQGTANKYLTQTSFTDSLKQILTNDSDLLTRDINGNIVRFGKGQPSQVLAMNNNATNFQWINTIESTSLDQLSDVEIANPVYSELLFYDNFGFNPPRWINKSVTTSLIPEPAVANPPNKYWTQQRCYDYLLSLFDNFSILYNNNGNIEGIPKGVTNSYLKSDSNSTKHSPTYSGSIYSYTIGSCI